MKKWSKKWTIRAVSLALAAACLCAGAALAASGDENDPLVTLSYLTQTVTPDILRQVDAKAEARQEELLQQFNDALDSRTGQSSAGGDSAPAGSASFTVVTLASGQKMALGVGCEVMLRVGSATVSSNTAPALIDVSSGGTLASGASLATNHLYMATIADRSLTATAATVKLLVRGDYTIS